MSDTPDASRKTTRRDTAKPALWSHSEGARGYRVRVFERVAGGPLWISSGRRAESLGHRNRDQAKKDALAAAAAIADGRQLKGTRPATVGDVLDAYLRERSPYMEPAQQEFNRHMAELWGRFLGRSRPMERVGETQWDEFLEARASGRIDPRGNRVDNAAERVEVRGRTVQYNCAWLKRVCAWAHRQRPNGKDRLLRDNVVADFALPEAKNPRRPVAKPDRFAAVHGALLALRDQERRRAKDAPKKRGAAHARTPARALEYLPELLALCFHTGRRVSAVMALRASDLRLERVPDVAPFGAIVWPADTDKEGEERRAPLNVDARAAIDAILAARPAVGPVPLFPRADGEPLTDMKGLRYWLTKAEAVAGVPKHDGSLFHAYRRGWASERRHNPKREDVAAAGGWKNVEILQRCYFHEDEEGMLAAVLNTSTRQERQA